MEALEGNKVKLVVVIDEEEFEQDLNRAFKKLAKEVRLPGFRPGKAPRKVLEARIGSEYARQEALQDGLPNYYVDAVKEHEVDVIAPPEIDITDGEESGPITFDAVVEVRPSVEISGYDALEVTVPSPEVDEELIDAEVERMLGPYGTLEDADRPAEPGDRVTMDIRVVHDGEELEGLTQDDYTYEVGMGGLVPELDTELEGVSVGDSLEFTADHPDEDEEAPLEFSIEVKQVQTTVLPEADDAWAAENTEFDSLDALKDDLREKQRSSSRDAAIAARRNGAAEALGALVSDDDVPEALVTMEFENRVQDMSMRLQASGLSLEQFMQFTGQPREQFVADLREQAGSSARIDLALRALAAAEGIEVSDEDLDAEFAQVSEQVGRPIADIRAEFTDAGQLPAVRSDLQKSKALDWLIERVKVVDEEGNPIDAASLEAPEPETGDDANSEGDDA